MSKLSIWSPWGLMPRDWPDWDEFDWDLSDVQMDVFEEGDEVKVKVKAPGFKKEEIDVTVESGNITITGRASEEVKEEDKKRKYFRREISKRSFTRTCALPVDVVASKAEARFDNGVLTVSLPKSEEAKPKKIDIKVG